MESVYKRTNLTTERHGNHGKRKQIHLEDSTAYASYGASRERRTYIAPRKRQPMI